MGSNVEWKTAIYSTINANRNILKGTRVDEHPLQINSVTNSITKRALGLQSDNGRSAAALILEPLSAALEGLDPLTQFAQQELDNTATEVEREDQSFNKISTKSKQSKINLRMESWISQRNNILAKFTTSQKLSIISSFLPEGEKVIGKVRSNAVDKVQYRLEQLDYFEEGSQRRLDLSQSEYVSRIEQLSKELVSAWHSEQRVKALKIAIQCSKLLSDTDVLGFYPSKFVLITDILDIFGQLVYDRLRSKADCSRSSIKPGSFLAVEVPESAKETCRNWFFKIASIRELVPRLYVEMALLKSYSFLSTRECSDALLRLTQMIQGIGNPLVAVYARCYLCRVGLTTCDAGEDMAFLKQNFWCFLDCYNHLFSRCVKQDLLVQKMEMSEYMILFTPALNFILKAVASDASESLFSEMLERCKKLGNSLLILNAIMVSFKPFYTSSRAIQFLEIINTSKKDDLPSYLSLCTFGLCISECPPPSEQKKQVLRTVWKHISTINVPEHYISCVEVWMSFTMQHVSIQELNTILSDIIGHMNIEAYEQYYDKLKIIVNQIVSNIQDFDALLAMDNFLPLVDLFKQETVKVEVCKNILTSCSSGHRTCDPVVINALMYLCCVLHDSVNALTVEDERRQIGEILCNIIRKIDYGRDFEQQLNFYVEARAAFANIDAVLFQLVQCVNTLAYKTRLMVKGHHNHKTADFVRACAAYCFITIPSIESVQTQLELYLLSGQVALFNHCFGQADACFKTALSIAPELAQSEAPHDEQFMVSFVRSFLSVLLVVPDSPDRGVLNLTRMLLNMLQTVQWTQKAETLCSLYLNVLDLLSVMAQESYPYHVYKVDSNDSLYGSDPKFIAEINKMCSLILGETLSHLKQLDPSRKQSTLALELLTKIAIRGDLSCSYLQTLLFSLWELIWKHGNADVKYTKRTLEYLKRYSISVENEILQKSVEKLAIPSR